VTLQARLTSYRPVRIWGTLPNLMIQLAPRNAHAPLTVYVYSLTYDRTLALLQQ